MQHSVTNPGVGLLCYADYQISAPPVEGLAAFVSVSHSLQ